MAGRWFAVAALASAALAASSPKSLKSDVTVIVDNDLRGPDSPDAEFGALYLSTRQSFRDAEASCQELGEELWSPDLFRGGVGKALSAWGHSSGDAEAWVASDGGKNRAVSVSGAVRSPHENVKLPVLCTQTAPWSNISYQNTDKRWRVQTTTNNENLVGFRDHLSFRFLGVRYAAQPKRFTYSTVYKGSGKTVSATEYGAECVQAGVNGSEDCLFLNVFTPYLPQSSSHQTQELKPVLFWIHGGAFTSGTGSDPTFDGGNLASRGDVVVVTINYRLSTLGYLALDDGVTNGNFGFGDQIVALEWVRDNIRDLGGDPDRITIFGQSAGAGSVRGMMASKKALGKFSGVIMMSNLGGLAYGTTYSKYYTIPQEVQVAANPILNDTGCEDAKSQVQCLRGVDANTLVNLPNVANYMVVDGTYLTTPQLELRGPKLPFQLMMGTEADDGTPFITYPPDVQPQQTAWLTSQGLPYPPRSLFPLPPLANRTLAVDRMAARLATDAIFRCVDEATAYAGLQRGGVFDRVFYYEFERSYQTNGWPDLNLCEPPVTPGHPYGDPEAPIGYDKCHSGELYYAFGNILRMGLPFRDAVDDHAFEQEVLDRWAAFAWTHDPNIPGAVRWSPAVRGDMRMMLLDLPGETMHGFKEAEQCDWLGLPLDYYM